MKFSRAGIFLLALSAVLSSSGCSFYNSVMARKSVVDGAEAFRGRKFDQAEQLFRNAVNTAPAGSKEFNTAELFLARTLHSEFAANRENKAKAEEAIEVYKKVIAANPEDGTSFKAVANLYESLDKKDAWRQWVTERAENASVPAEQRAEAYTSLAAKENTCANDISDVEPVKKTVTKDGKQVFVFTKPANPADFETFRVCVQRGTDLVNKAMELDKNNESTWSYKTSLLVQQMRLAEMEGRNEDKERLKTESETAKAEFTRLADIARQKREAEEVRKKAEAEAKDPAAAAANTNTNAQ